MFIGSAPEHLSARGDSAHKLNNAIALKLQIKSSKRSSLLSFYAVHSNGKFIFKRHRDMIAFETVDYHDQIWLFLKEGLGNKISFKSCQNTGQRFGLFKQCHFLSKNCCDYFWKTLGSYQNESSKTIDSLFNIRTPLIRSRRLLKKGQPRPLFCLFLPFSTNFTILTTNKCEKMSISIRRFQDSNSQPSDYVSHPLTTRPGLPKTLRWPPRRPQNSNHQPQPRLLARGQFGLENWN